MTRHAFETIVRHATAAPSPGLAAILGAPPHAASAADPGVQAAGKAGKTCKKKAKQRCSNDAATCRALVPGGCNNEPVCIAAVVACCDACSANGFLTCLNAAAAAAA